MNATQTNFFKPNKKLNNLYSTDPFKVLNLDVFPRGKSSCSPMRSTGLADLIKKNKINSKIPIMSSFNKHYRTMDVVIYFY